MYVPDEPRFRPGWFRFRDPPAPPWMADENWVPSGESELYTRARSGLWVIARDVYPAGATVLLPAYVPRSVVQTFLSCDVEVEYYPVGTSLRLPRDRVRDRIETVAPDAVVFVHYFGFADPAFHDLAAAARDAGASVVEDCARALFGHGTRGNLLGSTGEFALFSLRKVLPVPNGGLVVATDGEYRFPRPTAVSAEYRDAAVAVAIRAFETVGVNPVTLNGSTAGAGSGGEASGSTRDVELQFSTTAPGRLTRLGLRRTDPSAVVTTRRRRYAEVRGALASIDGVEVLTPALHEGASPFGVAIRFPDGEATRDRVYERLVRDGLPSQRLRWRLRQGEQPPDAYPDARTLRRQLLVVPTHQQVPRGIEAPVAASVADAMKD